MRRLSRRFFLLIVGSMFIWSLASQPAPAGSLGPRIFDNANLEGREIAPGAVVGTAERRGDTCVITKPIVVGAVMPQSATRGPKLRVRFDERCRAVLLPLDSTFGR